MLLIDTVTYFETTVVGFIVMITRLFSLISILKLSNMSPRISVCESKQKDAHKLTFIF